MASSLVSLRFLHNRGPPEGPPAEEGHATRNPEASEGKLGAPGVGARLLDEAGKPVMLPGPFRAKGLGAFIQACRRHMFLAVLGHISRHASNRAPLPPLPLLAGLRLLGPLLLVVLLGPLRPLVGTTRMPMRSIPRPVPLS